MDVREGGACRATMFAGPERHEIQWQGEYREVVAPERRVLTFDEAAGQGWSTFFDRMAERLGGD
jgi:uncharacterized protein YndB with AHSA1/START domain